MRMSKLFGQTLREIPTEAEVASHQLLLRAGFIRPLGAGIFTLMPLGKLAIKHIEGIMHESMHAMGGQEIFMPVVHPAEIWKETGRWYSIDAEMARFKDRSGRDMVLAMTHEEIVADLVRNEVHSYRQLPTLVYHIQTKFRDDPRPRAGLIRVREFSMLDSYSLDRDEAGLDAAYQAHYQVFLHIFQRCGIPVKVVGSDSGMMGGKQTLEFMYLTPIGEDTLFFCSQCDYAANLQAAKFTKHKPPLEVLRSVEKVATPNVGSIEALSTLLGVPKSKTAKAVFYMAELAGSETPCFIFAVLRGDMTLNETKLSNATAEVIKSEVIRLRPAKDDEILAVGAVPGYASPLSVRRKDVLLIVDDLIPQSPNLVAGANIPGYHLLNVNYGRDYIADLVTDIASAEEGSPCPVCSNPMHAHRGVEVGHIFKLGSRYSEALGCRYLDEDGEEKPVIMGSYGIGLGRLLACVAEEHHDEKGLIWPVSIAPFPIHLLVLASRDGKSEETAEALYQQLCESGLTPLYDDRDERTGVKFNDADLIGLPIRLTISERTLAKGRVEFKRRDQDEKQEIALADVVQTLKAEVRALENSLEP